MSITRLKDLVIILLVLVLVATIVNRCNTHKSDQSTITTLNHELSILKSSNEGYKSKISSFVHLQNVADSLDKYKKEEHFSKSVKERIVYIKTVAPNITISDTTFTAGVEFADTIYHLKVSLETCQTKTFLKDSVITYQQAIHSNDSTALSKMEIFVNEADKKVVKAERKVKVARTVNWVIGGALAVSLLLHFH